MNTKASLEQLSAGQSVTNNNNLQNANVVQVAAYSPANNCQTGSGARATMKGTELNPFALIGKPCGIVGFAIDNAGEGQTVQEVSFGGPFDTGRAGTVATFTGVAGGFNTASLIIAIEDMTLGGGVTATSAAGLAYFNMFNTGGFSVAVEQFYLQNVDSTNSAIALFIAQGLRPYSVNVANDYNFDESGTIQPVITSVGGGNLVNVSWPFQNPIALTTATGIFMDIEAVDLTLYVCVSFVEANKLYNPCTA